ncbi:MAG TPA: GMC family oxidoreductase [Longimicrobium sp.]
MNTPTWDAVIVGAGIAGALTAYKLALAGKRVLVLDAGPAVPPNRGDYMQRFYTAMSKVPESPYPDIPDAPRPRSDDSGTLTTNPARPTPNSYLVQTGPLPFASTYERVGGGTTWHWLGTALRLLPNDFQTQTTYGVGVDWPITYDQLETWYCQAEAEIGVAGDMNQQSYLNLTFSQQYPMPGIAQSYADTQMAAAIGSGMTFDGLPVTVTPTPQARNSRPYDGRRQCAGNTNCIPICPIQAKYDASVHLNKARQLGVTVWSQTVVDRLVVDPGSGRITGVSYKQYQVPDGPATATGTVSGTLVVMAAHAIETPKILLNSATSALPGGVANRSGMVGRNLMDHPVQLSWARMTSPVYPFRGPLSTSGIESLRDGPFRTQRAPFRMEMGNEGWNWAAGDPYTTVNAAITGNGSPGVIGGSLVSAVNQGVIGQVRFGSLVEQQPLSTNRVTLSPVMDSLGIPRPQISYDLDAYTMAGFAAARQAAHAVFQRIGAQDFTEPTPPTSTGPWPFNFTYQEQEYTLNGAGHVMGTYRMGNDPAQSVVGPTLKSHDHPNLYLLGSGVFPTVGTSNPTLTIAALALMAAPAMLQDLA